PCICRDGDDYKMKADKLRLSKLAQYFQRFRAAGIYLPNRLIFPLGAGCLVLFSFFVIPQSQYTNFEPLFAKRQSKGEMPPTQEENSVRKTQIAVRVLGMETDSQIPEAADPQRFILVSERVGMNIFIRSGYLKSASLVTDSSGPPPPVVNYKLELDETPRNCAALGAAEGENDAAQASHDTAESESNAAQASHDTAESESNEAQRMGDTAESESNEAQQMRDTATRLAISAVAVEKFHRNILHRRMEWAYVR